MRLETIGLLARRYRLLESVFGLTFESSRLPAWLYGLQMANYKEEISRRLHGNSQDDCVANAPISHHSQSLFTASVVLFIVSDEH